jgi:predicted aminopeptidase
MIDAVSKAMRKAWQLGQTYWRQADSDYVSDHRRSEETQRQFDALVDETRAMLAAASKPPEQAEQHRALSEGQREALKEAICWAQDDGLPGTADHLRTLLDTLDGGKHA